MNFSIAVLQGGAVAWGVLGLASTVLSASTTFTIIAVGVALLTQCMAYGAVHTK